MLAVRHCQTNRLSPPAGTAADGETAQCTAYRETWEETGVEVNVGRLLSSFDDRFHLFHCLAVDESVIRNSELQVPEPFRHEICEILFLNPALSSDEDWRFPEQLPGIKDAFTRISNQPGEN
jgi:ADP-ribose pyrophosphatase YjhB (NUDIX family)